MASSIKLMEYLASDEWKREKAFMAKKYGRMIGIVEIKEMAEKEGKTFRDKWLEVTGHSLESIQGRGGKD